MGPSDCGEPDEDHHRNDSAEILLPAHAAPVAAPLWTGRAACRDHRDLNWDNPTGYELIETRRVCQECPVQMDCLRAGIENQEPSGIWGGSTVEERQALTRQRKKRKPLPPHGSSSRYVRHHCSCDICKNAHSARERANRAKRKKRVR